MAVHIWIMFYYVNFKGVFIGEEYSLERALRTLFSDSNCLQMFFKI